MHNTSNTSSDHSCPYTSLPHSSAFHATRQVCPPCQPLAASNRWGERIASLLYSGCFKQIKRGRFPLDLGDRGGEEIWGVGIQRCPHFLSFFSYTNYNTRTISCNVEAYAHLFWQDEDSPLQYITFTTMQWEGLPSSFPFNMTQGGGVNSFLSFPFNMAQQGGFPSLSFLFNTVQWGEFPSSFFPFNTAQ